MTRPFNQLEGIDTGPLVIAEVGLVKYPNTCTDPVDGCRSQLNVMLTGDGNVLGALSTTLESDCVAPAPTLMVIAPASAALGAGGALRVDSTMACPPATPVRSAEPASATRHERSN